MTRLLVYTGRGGAGVTTCAAASALHLARETTTALVSIDPKGSLSSVFDAEVGPEPTPVGPNLTAVEINPQAGQDTYRESFQRIAETVSVAGIDLTDGHVARMLESTHVPFGREVAALEAVASFVGDADYGAVVFDTGLRGRLFRLLRTPGLLGQGVDVASMALETVGDGVDATVEGTTERLTAATDPLRRPLDSALAGSDRSPGVEGGHDAEVDGSGTEAAPEAASGSAGASPVDGADDADRDRELLASRVASVREVLGGAGDRELRFVTTPDRVSAGWTDHLVRNIRTAGVPAGPLVVNEVVEDGSCCARCATRREQQQAALAPLRDRDDLEVRTLPDLRGEVSGDALLERLAARLVES